MGEETARKLQQLMSAEAQQRAVVDDLKHVCVESVADGLGGRLDAYAKRLAKRQPDVAKKLDRDGIEALRSELAAAAGDLADELREATGEIAWPHDKYQITSRDIHSALFNFMYGHRVNRLTAIFRAHGFWFDETAGVLPQELYDMNGFDDLASALQNLRSAEESTSAAKADDDNDIVDSLWEDS